MEVVSFTYFINKIKMNSERLRKTNINLVALNQEQKRFNSKCILRNMHKLIDEKQAVFVNNAFTLIGKGI